jgi:hypothetical protein
MTTLDAPCSLTASKLRTLPRNWCDGHGNASQASRAVSGQTPSNLGAA